MGDMKRVLILTLELLLTVLIVQGQPSLNIKPEKRYTGTTLTVTCDLTGITTLGVFIFKGIDQIYTCPFTNSPCSDNDGLSEYSDVDWSQADNAVFTISNADSTRDDGVWTCSGDTTTQKSNEISVSIRAPTVAVLSVQNVGEGDTATFECSYSSITSTSLLEIKKDGVLKYDCANINFPCNAHSGDTDYSAVTFTGIGTTSGKGTFTVKNADQARDGGSWLCRYGSSLESDPVIFVVNETNDVKEKLPFIAVAIPLFGLVIVVFIVTRYKTLVISTLYVKVSKNTVQLSWKPFGFEPVPDTLYAKCAQNGLTENAKIIDGLFVVVFRDLVPGQQHDVTVYCQNAADMKLYKSETCVVFTLKDSSNTNPKESKPVLALHSLDLTVYQTKVELSWTSPLAFDSTKVEYWVGSDNHITMSADKTSLATSNAEMTRLLPDSVITFTITGEKNGTQYRSGVLHQKTLKGLTGCCP